MPQHHNVRTERKIMSQQNPKGGYAAQRIQSNKSSLFHWTKPYMPMIVMYSEKAAFKFTCPGCELNAWAKPDAVLIRGDCQTGTGYVNIMLPGRRLSVSA